LYLLMLFPDECLHFQIFSNNLLPILILWLCLPLYCHVKFISSVLFISYLFQDQFIYWHRKILHHSTHIQN
jgi:hypothetical protein